MGTKVNISIPQPCHENWQAMTIVEKGRFCASCQKNVFDFTTSSDRQIIETFKNNENLCGRFTTSQLNRDLIAPKERSSIWLASTSAIVSFLGLGSQEIFAQGEPIKTEQTDKKVVSNNETTTTSNQEKEITGIVSDETMPIPSVNVVIKGTTIGTQTDFDGKYSIKVNEGDILVFSFIGMVNKELIVDKSIYYPVKMEEAVVGGAIKKRTFLGRIFYKIGNIFR